MFAILSIVRESFHYRNEHVTNSIRLVDCWCNAHFVTFQGDRTSEVLKLFAVRVMPQATLQMEASVGLVDMFK